MPGWTTDQPAGEHGRETSLAEYQNVEGREDGIINIPETNQRQKTAWSSAVLDEGRVGRFLTPFRAPKTVEPEERFPERSGLPVVVEVLVSSVSASERCAVYCSRGAGGGEKRQKGQGIPVSNK